MSGLKEIAENIVVSYDRRMRIVNSLAEDTRNLLQSFRERREAMAKELREVLAKSENLRKKDFNKMMEEILLTQAARENTVNQILADFRQEEETVSQQLRKLLLRGEAIRVRDFKKVLARIRREQEKRRKEAGEKASAEMAEIQKKVADMLAGFKSEREKMAAEWKKVTDTLSGIKKAKVENYLPSGDLP